MRGAQAVAIHNKWFDVWRETQGGNWRTARLHVHGPVSSIRDTSVCHRLIKKGQSLGGRVSDWTVSINILWSLNYFIHN